LIIPKDELRVFESVVLQKSAYRRKIAAIVKRGKAAILLPLGLKKGKQAAGQLVRQELVDQRERCEFARKSVDQEPSGAEDTCAILEENRIVAKVLDDRLRDDEIYGALPKRQSTNRRICNDLTFEEEVAAQLLGGVVNGDNQMPLGLLGEGEKWAILPSSDIENDLARPTVQKVRNFMLVQGMQMALERSGKPILRGLAQSSVGGDEASE